MQTENKPIVMNSAISPTLRISILPELQKSAWDMNLKITFGCSHRSLIKEVLVLSFQMQVIKFNPQAIAESD